MTTPWPAPPPPPPAPGHPVQLSVDRDTGSRNRLTVGLRFLWVIPIAIVLSALMLILFRQKYPRWWFDWNVGLLRFSNRVAAYALLLRDEYPSTDEEQAVHLVVLAVPVGLAEGLELASSTLVLLAVMPRDALGVDGDR